MAALNIRDIGQDRKAALDEEARLAGVSVAELVRRYLDDGLRAGRAAREKAEWQRSARDGLTYEIDRTATNGPSLARYRQPVTGRSDG